MQESSTLSVRSCRMICLRVAPSAERMEIYPVRVRARPSSMLAMLAQAMRRTKNTVPSIIRKTTRISPPLKAVWNVCTSTPPVFVGIRKLLYQALSDQLEILLRLLEWNVFGNNPEALD